MKLLILDKDGTLVRPASGEKFVQHPHDQELIPGVSEAIARYAADGWTMAIASNQGGVAAGYKTLDDAIAEMEYLGQLFRSIGQKEPHIVFCPVFDGSECYSMLRNWFDKDHGWSLLHSSRFTPGFSFPGKYRKPNAGMLNALMSLHPSAEYLMVGDRPEDKQAAANAGVNSCGPMTGFYVLRPNRSGSDYNRPNSKRRR